MSYAETQSKRLVALAASADTVKQRNRYLRLALQWAERALETVAQREARIEREHCAYVTRMQIRDAERSVRRAEIAARAERWAIKQALRYPGETLEQRQVRVAAESQRFLERRAARATLPVKIKKKRCEANRERQEARAERQRQREAIAEAKRAAKRKPVPAALPPLPY